jgi:hypothetical protein
MMMAYRFPLLKTLTAKTNLHQELRLITVIVSRPKRFFNFTLFFFSFVFSHKLIRWAGDSVPTECLTQISDKLVRSVSPFGEPVLSYKKFY